MSEDIFPSPEEFNQEFNESFCIKPFTEICNTPNNHLKLCCHSDENIWIDRKLDKKTLYENFQNHPRFVEIRQKMLKGERVDACNVCYRKEKIHGSSARIHHTTILDAKEPEVVKNIIEYGELSLKTMDIKFGNKCNLGCVMCGKGASSVIAKEWQNNVVPKNSGFEQLSLDDEVITEFDSVEFESLKDQVKHLRRFSAKGGEPMILPEYHDWINFLVDSGYSEDISVYVITNGTVNFAKDLEKMSKFKEFEVCWSIDAVGKPLEYVRWPVSFKKLSENHRKICEQVKQHGYDNITFMMNTVAHALNIDQIVKVAEYADSLELVDNIEFLNCHGPAGMLNSVISEKTLENFKNDVDNYHGKHKSGLKKLYNEVEYNWYEIREQKQLQNHLQKLKNMTDFWQKVRGLNVEEYCPTYADTIAQLK